MEKIKVSCLYCTKDVYDFGGFMLKEFQEMFPNLKKLIIPTWFNRVSSALPKDLKVSITQPCLRKERLAQVGNVEVGMITDKGLCYFHVKNLVLKIKPLLHSYKRGKLWFIHITL